MTATIQVRYKNVEGYHIFTSPDVYGLYVASKDARRAYEAVAPSLEKLIRLNENIKVTVEAADSFDDFVHMLRADCDMPHPAMILADRQYVAKAAA